MKNMFLKFGILIFAITMLFTCSQNPTVAKSDYEIKAAEVRIENATSQVGDKIKKIKKSKAEWRAELTEMEYYVLREAGTERAFTGDLWDNKKKGIYTCAACDLPLFDSSTKYKSGTGWPSYFQPIKENHVEEDVDYKIGYKRVEVHCARCEGHLGHIFSDGPQPTGLRYCINSVSLNFEEKE